ncbi:MAG: tRNA pseudouridine(38-40) synthase TruA [Helicobacteraceae bacterium]|jgi:tRNA pseudouridine38-40 synthase|nr:tRNA pseudouridine(38-40) synthase TruA [Helicobacteraceae bacterium]
MKAKVTIAYDGALFYGSQLLRESGANSLPSVLSVFEDALKSMGIFAKTEQAGRTDRYVHATGQVFAFKLPEFWRDLALLKAELIKKLYPKIHIRKVEIVRDDFHPRFRAKSRIYRYVISRDPPFIFQANFAAFAPEFDLDRARRAIQKFVGKKDFYNFSKRGGDEKTTIREIYSAKIYEYKNLFVIRFEGDAFLRSQVRLMCAAIIKIAGGKAETADIDAQFSGEKCRFRTPAPPQGLYLARVKY